MPRVKRTIPVQSSGASSTRPAAASDGPAGIAWSEQKALKVIQAVRKGATLGQLPAGSPDRTTVYDWMRGGAKLSDGRAFADAYAEACEDRRLTWQDQAAEAVMAASREKNPATMAVANSLATQLRAAAKESIISLQERRTVGGITVVIRTYGDPEFQE